MILLRQLFKFVELLHTEKSAHQLSRGFVMGMFMGFTPMPTLHGILYFVVLFTIRANLGAAFLSMALFSVVAFPLDPLFHSIGRFALRDLSSLHGLWATLYHAPIVPYTRFNNSIVMGSFTLSLVLSLPLYWFCNRLVQKYQEKVVEKIRDTNFVRAIMATKLVRLYAQYRQFGK